MVCSFVVAWKNFSWPNFDLKTFKFLHDFQNLLTIFMQIAATLYESEHFDNYSIQEIV